MGEIAVALGAVSFFGFLTAATIAGTVQERRKRELEHTERMKRLELGLNDPPTDSSWPRALVCASIGAGVPFSAFVVTMIAYLNKVGADDEIWIAPVVVSVLSVTAAAALAKSLLGKGPSDPSAGPEGLAAKPVHDPDAYDHVGRRG